MLTNYQHVFHFPLSLKHNSTNNELQTPKESFQYYLVDICIHHCELDLVEHQQFFQEVQGRRAVENGNMGHGPVGAHPIPSGPRTGQPHLKGDGQQHVHSHDLGE